MAKIRLYHNPENGLGINRNGSFINLMQEVECILFLNKTETIAMENAFKKRSNEYQHQRVTLALYDFTHCNACTKHHKYKIWKTFDGIPNIKYQWL